MSTRGLSIAIVGATGAVGREMIALLEDRAEFAGHVRLLASSRSVGQRIGFRGEQIEVELLCRDSFAHTDIALFSAGGSVSLEFAPAAVQAGATVVDNSSAFRMDGRYPLVVPEINANVIRPDTIIANPNCSTIIMLMAVTPIRRMFGVKRIIVSTYQAASGAGAAAMRELETQTRAVLEGEREPAREVFDEICAFNVFSHNSAIGEDGYNVEERKMAEESRKIWSDHDVRITATCIRVPVMRTHGESINLTLDREIGEEDLDAVREAIRAFPGVALLDDREGNRFPTSLRATGANDVLVGRLRLDRSQETNSGRSTGLEMFVTGDQIRKGAALNAVQIAEVLVRDHLQKRPQRR